VTDGRWRSQCSSATPEPTDRTLGGPGRTPTSEGAPEVVGPTDEDLAVFLDLGTEILGVFSPDGSLRWCSATAAAALGYDEEGLHHLDPAPLVHPEDAPLVERLVRTSGSGVGSATARYRARDGSWRSFEWTARVEAGSGLVVGVARDVTGRLHARTDLFTGETRLQAIVDHSTAAVSVKDLRGRYVLVNDAFVRPLGLTRLDVIDKTARELWPNASTLSDDRDTRAVEDGVGSMYDEVLHLADGPHTYMTVRFPLRDDAGAVVGVAAIATDVTERKRAEVILARRDRLLDTIVRASPDVVTVLDAKGTVTEISKASTSILDDQPSPDDLDRILHPDDRPAVDRGFRDLLARRIDHLDIRHRVRRADGEWVTFDTHAEAVVGEDGRANGAVAVSRDVTADLEFEEQLRAAVAAAEQASSTKSDFLSRMSHELRTPLNSVLGFAQLLEMDALGFDQAEAVGHILRAGRHLVDLIDEVLDIARIESGRLNLSVERVHVAAVLRDAVDLTRPLSERSGISVSLVVDETAGAGHVAADRQRLLQVMLNLLSNAVKYNHPGGTVEIGAGPAPGNRVRISVTDTGRGIRPEDLPRLFDPFDRLGAERTGVQGTGVGLTLSKHLVERMGGELTVRSEPGVGSVFSVELAAVEAPDTSSPTTPSPTASAAAGVFRVLYVEDNLANLELVEQVLARRAGIELRSAMSGGRALELARRHRPDLILLDLHLPDMLGTEVFDRLQSEPTTADIPVVVVSADATPTQIERLLGAGVAAYLTKPIDVRELLDVVAVVAAGERVS
jgi:PAS domain S-box-containing protein